MKSKPSFKEWCHNLWESFVAHISFLWHWKNFFFCLKYPFWKSRNVWSGRFMGYSFTWYDEIPGGWKKAFGKELSRDIKSALKAARKRIWKDKHKLVKTRDMLHWQQIKEKWGELCLYASAVTEVMDVLDRYEKLSTCYCISCGKPARYVTHGWVEFFCEDCYVENLKYHKCSDEDIEKYKLEDRLTSKDIPEFTEISADSDKPIKVDMKEKYGIDYAESWGLDHEKEK